MISKNMPCWCGSGKKYKHCHEEWDNTINVLKLQGQQVPSHNLIKSPDDIKWIKKAAKINNEILDLVEKEIHAGMSTEDIDKMVYDYTVSHGAIPACLGYEGFPKSVCTSINSEVCHGIPNKNIILKEGDIINVDCTTIVHQHYADASRTFCIGQVSDEAKKLVEVTKELKRFGLGVILAILEQLFKKLPMLTDIVLLEISVVMELEMLSMKIHMYIMLESKIQVWSLPQEWYLRSNQ